MLSWSFLRFKTRPMREVYQPTKPPDYGVNSCASCFQKQLTIDRLRQENESLRGELQRLKPKAVEGFFHLQPRHQSCLIKRTPPKRKARGRAEQSSATLVRGVKLTHRKKSKQSGASKWRRQVVRKATPLCGSKAVCGLRCSTSM